MPLNLSSSFVTASVRLQLLSQGDNSIIADKIQIDIPSFALTFFTNANGLLVSSAFPIGSYDITVDTTGKPFTRLTRQITTSLSTTLVQNLLLLPALSVVSLASPDNGEDGINVARATFFTFSVAIDSSSVRNTTLVARTLDDQIIEGDLHIAPDKKRLTLFYKKDLPSNSRVRVTLDGSALKDVLGRLVDVDGDGVAGGSKVYSWTTLSITLSPGTSVCGRVFQSQLVQVGATALNKPLAGATITVRSLHTDENVILFLGSA